MKLTGPLNNESPGELAEKATGRQELLAVSSAAASVALNRRTLMGRICNKV